MKKIITVTGPVDANLCRMVLPHEHIFIDLTNQAAPAASDKKLTAADHSKLLCDPYCMRDNLQLDEFDTAVSEGKALLEAGCDTIVDCTLRGIGRDPLLLKKFSEESGINVVAGCGWYTGDTHPEAVQTKSVSELADMLLCEVISGIDGTGIKPGVIGEIGTSKNILPGEWKALEAAAIVQKQTGLALQIHIYPWSANGSEVTAFLTARGVDPSRIVICHSDIAPDYGYISSLLKAGVYVELDNFGKEFTPADGGFAGGDFARDEVRAEIAARIIQDGFGDQLLLTNDICLKCMLSKYGGKGYTHIFNNILPMISKHGIRQDYLKETVMRRNPLQMLTGR